MAVNTVEDWTDLTAVVDDLDKKEKERQKLSKIENKVFVDTLGIKSNRFVETVVFDSIERVFHFWIDGQENYQTSKPLPKLKLPEKLKMDFDLDTDFNVCFDNNGLIDNYYQYRDKKWEYYLKTIKDNHLLDKYRPEFVSFGGPISDILATVYDTSIEWKICAEKANDVIYLSKTRNERFKGDYFSKQTARHSYRVLKYLHLVTDRDDNQMTEFEKCFVINFIDFVGHRVLTLNELDAIDDHNKPIDIKLVKRISSAKDNEFFIKKRLLRFWSKASVGGVDRLIIGNTDTNNCLLDINVRKVEDIAEDCSHKWSNVNCLNFLNRFFTFVKSCTTEEKIIYEFDFKPGEEHIVCNRIHPNLRQSILPLFYSQS